MRVQAVELGPDKKYSGYYNLVRRKPGDVFDLLDERHFSQKWMKKVPSNTPKTAAPGEPSKEDLIADGQIPAEDNKRHVGRPRKDA